MYFLVIKVLVVKDGELLHTGFHLSTQPRILLHYLIVVCAHFVSLIDLLNKIVELLNTTLDFVANTGQHLQFQLKPGHTIVVLPAFYVYIYVKL